MRIFSRIAVSLLCFSLGVQAATESTTPATQTTPQPLSTDRLAQRWGLSQQEWQHYLELKLSERGIWSPTLDPLTTLGVEANSDAERRKYADLLVEKEARRVEKELAFQRAYDTAWKRRFPALMPVEDSRLPPPLTPDSRLAVFVREACPPCETHLKNLLRSQHPLDIWLVGSGGDDTRLRRWALSQHIDIARVKSHQVTLNHDAGRWLQLGQGQMPAILEQREGQWQPVTVP
jgi:integrating conjugative element protein (TIGR03759 family)